MQSSLGSQKAAELTKNSFFFWESIAWSQVTFRHSLTPIYIQEFDIYVRKNITVNVWPLFFMNFFLSCQELATTFWSQVSIEFPSKGINFTDNVSSNIDLSKKFHTFPRGTFFQLFNHKENVVPFSFFFSSLRISRKI